MEKDNTAAAESDENANGGLGFAHIGDLPTFHGTPTTKGLTKIETNTRVRGWGGGLPPSAQKERFLGSIGGRLVLKSDLVASVGREASGDGSKVKNGR